MPAARLGDIAYARSGDKGSGANVGVLAYNQAGYDYIYHTLTGQAVENYFKRMGVGAVTRYEMPNILAFNFMLPNILAGGGSRSLRIDAQGKTLGQVLLEMPLDIPGAVLQSARRTA
jgi:hypothetical protein